MIASTLKEAHLKYADLHYAGKGFEYLSDGPVEHALIEAPVRKILKRLLSELR